MRTLLYDSQDFFVIESPARGSIEVIDKQCRRGAYLEGRMAERLRASLCELTARRSSAPEMDQLLRQYAWLCTNPLHVH